MKKERIIRILESFERELNADGIKLETVIAAAKRACVRHALHTEQDSETVKWLHRKEAMEEIERIWKEYRFDHRSTYITVTTARLPRHSYRVTV